MGMLRMRSTFVSVLLALIAMWSMVTYSAEHAVPNPATVAAPEALDCTLIESVLAAPDDYVIIDARSPSEYDTGHVSGAVNLPFDSVSAYADVLPEDKQSSIVAYCRSGRRATVLKSLLLDLGYTNISVVPGEQMLRGEKTLSFQCGE